MVRAAARTFEPNGGTARRTLPNREINRTPKAQLNGLAVCRSRSLDPSLCAMSEMGAGYRYARERSARCRGWLSLVKPRVARPFGLDHAAAPLSVAVPHEIRATRLSGGRSCLDGARGSYRVRHGRGTRSDSDSVRYGGCTRNGVRPATFDAEASVASRWTAWRTPAPHCWRAPDLECFGRQCFRQNLTVGPQQRQQPRYARRPPSAERITEARTSTTPGFRASPDPSLPRCALAVGAAARRRDERSAPAPSTVEGCARVPCA